MAKLSDLIAYLNSLLEPEKFKDYCPNGLQVQGNETIKILVTGVTASQALINAAIHLDSDALLVHHGYFWKNEPASLVGIKYRRIKSLIENDISLIAYHLPLDAHPLYGNNIQLGMLLELESVQTFEIEGLPLGNKGRLEYPAPGDEFAVFLEEKLRHKPLFIKGNDRHIKQVAWCTGAAENYIQWAIEQNVDAYITGEISEKTFHIAKESEINVYVAGHHATERYGVKALGEHLAHTFGFEHHFVDINNPI
jgi:dinuclear metal center YbgI/SA1388 family protein